MRKWSIDDSAELYNINGWGLNYFSINEKGHVTVTPKVGGPKIDIKELMDLEVTQKYLDYYSISVTYMVEVMNRISRRFSSEECAKLEEMLRIVSKELMPEVTLPNP